MGDRRLRILQAVLGVAIIGFAARSLARNWEQLRAQPLHWQVEPGWILLSALVTWLMYALLIVAWRRMLAAWGRGLDLWSASRIWTVSSLGKYVPGKVWAVAGMAVMAQRAGVGAGAATGSAVILQVLAIGTGAAVAAATGWTVLGAAYPGATTGLVAILVAAVAGIGLVLWPPLVNRVLRLAAPEAGPITPPVGAVAFGIVANTVAWLGYGLALWLLARGLLPGGGAGPSDLDRGVHGLVSGRLSGAVRSGWDRRARECIHSDVTGTHRHRGRDGARDRLPPAAHRDRARRCGSVPACPARESSCRPLTKLMHDLSRHIPTCWRFSLSS